MIKWYSHDVHWYTIFIFKCYYSCKVMDDWNWSDIDCFSHKKKKIN